MSNVFVLDTDLRQLNPVHPGEARILLSSGKAAVYRRYPFTIVLKKAVETPIEPLRIKIDPGSKTTGIAIINDQTGEVVTAFELSHRGETIKARLDKRRTVRGSRRNRHTRYRKPRWQKVTGVYPLLITANGHGRRRMCSVDEYGFTYGNPKQSGRKYGFKTGDIVRAVVTEGKPIGTYVGRLTARATGSFNITTKKGTTQGIGYQYCRALHRSDGYSYQKGAAIVLAQSESEAVSASSQPSVQIEECPGVRAPRKEGLFPPLSGAARSIQRP
jgi:hypothetical protein